MELPQPRPYGSEGRKPTHDFLSLYSPVQQDPRSSQGGYLKTHDFLQPLEQVGKSIPKEENDVEITAVERPPPPAPPPSVEHLLPGGIGTYSISHISYISQRIPKPEGVMFTAAQASSSDRNDENSNCSSYTGSGFTLWEESTVNKGKTGKENIAEDRHIIRDAGVNIGGQWTPSVERLSQSSSNHNRRSSTFSSLSSSQPSPAQKNQSLIDMIKSAKSAQEEDDDEDEDEEFVIKQEAASLRGNLSVKADCKSPDQKPNTPRSKHSATEQRRRSKINDRHEFNLRATLNNSDYHAESQKEISVAIFHMLRELIPHNDQKRDKASFLLEVIEYIQFLQEKVHKYEESYQWNHEPPKLMPWGNSSGPAEGFVDQSRGTNCGPSPPLLFAAKFDENFVSPSLAVPRIGQNLVESELCSADTLKNMDHCPNVANKASPLPQPLQTNIFSPGGSTSSAAFPPRMASGSETRASQPHSRLQQSRSCTTECTVASDKLLKDQELTIESGTISISSVYSQGLLSTLTQALQSSGLDLSQASISVQIDLGKRANSTPNSSTSVVKNDDVPRSNQVMARSRLSSSGEESNQALKRLKTGRS
ncbi:hypothetical protein RJ639_009558 [Escallonia herrerae]|uniref:BHLH domain-containing protein n=1 Tax=Escallonia herrerae TaxID=1293975 RepID=A0AA88VWP8_9ASTE|nr:hypothetical protein RJ639_009558 [Escallonia herrerae]